jgi:organic radical activating enzyme
MTTLYKEDLSEKTMLLSDDKVFYTVEGEGEFVGYPSVFMRLSMCNLTCQGFASADSPHGCDSFISWRVKNKITNADLLQHFEQEGFKDHLYNGAIWKITGGEPLVQQPALLRFLSHLEVEWGWVPRIDFETNATIMPDKEWVRVGATFTTSPKLSNNGDPEDRRYKPEVLQWHAAQGSGFKFVIDKESDLEEVLEKYVEKFDIPTGRVWLMPCAGSRSEHIEKAPMVAELAKKHYFNFSPRLHLLVWDMALKV